MKLAGDNLSIPYSRFFLGVLPWYGVLIVLGAGLAIILSHREAMRLDLPPDTVTDLALRVLPIGILGARIYYVLFSLPSFLAHPFSVLFLWEGGLAIFGGILAGLLTVFFFCRRRKISLSMMLDLLSPGVVLAQAIGRWGNYFNQEAYGLAVSSSSPFAFFPLAVQIYHDSGLTWHLATFFYESFWDFLIYIFLLWGRRRLFRKSGDVFLFYLLLYSAGRLMIENFRLDSLYLGQDIRISQLLSLLCVLALLAVLIRRRIIHRIMLNPLHLLFTGLTFLTGLYILFFCLRNSFFSSLSPVFQFISLFLFFLESVVTALLLYGRSKPAEVLYAFNRN